MWRHHPRFRDKNGEPLLLKRCGRREFWPKQNIYDDRVGVARYFIEKFGADWKTHVMCRPSTYWSSGFGSLCPSSSSFFNFYLIFNFFFA